MNAYRSRGEKKRYMDCMKESMASKWVTHLAYKHTRPIIFPVLSLGHWLSFNEREWAITHPYILRGSENHQITSPTQGGAEDSTVKRGE